MDPGVRRGDVATIELTIHPCVIPECFCRGSSRTSAAIKLDSRQKRAGMTNAEILLQWSYRSSLYERLLHDVFVNYFGSLSKSPWLQAYQCCVTVFWVGTERESIARRLNRVALLAFA